MKKIKFFALTALLAMGMNAMAQSEKATETFSYTVSGTDATITGFVNGLTDAQMETLTIPATIVDETNKKLNVVGISSTTTENTKFDGNAKIKKVVVAANSNLTTIASSTFAKCANLAEVDLSNAEVLATIGDYAFAGTKITTLDLSATEVSVINKFNNTGSSDKALKANATLKTVVLNTTWTSIVADAFKACSALTSINLQKADKNWIKYASPTQTINGGAFVGTAIESLDFSGTILTTIPATLLKANVTDEYAALKTVKLNGSNAAGKNITNLNAAFANCPNLESIDIENDAELTSLTDNEFLHNAKLTSIDLTNITTLSTTTGHQFEGTGLTSVTIPAAITDIPASCFQDCAALKTVTFKHTKDNAFNSIATMAFAGDTQIESITIPVKLTDAADVIAEKAFFMCTGLKSVTIKPTGTTNWTNKGINNDAFLNCNDKAAANLITIYTNVYFKDPYGTSAPVCAKFSTDAAPAATIANLVWEKAKYVNANKYYVKVHTPAGNGIKIKAESGTKVYEAYLDGTNGTMNMMPYMVNGGYYLIGANSNALVITTNADIAWEANGDGSTNTSVLAKISETNAMEILGTATSATTILSTAGTKVIYGWVNNASVGTGWMKITSGTMPKNGLYILAEEPAAGRLTINWLDENGNVESETTAIENVKAAAAEAEDGVIYNLQGARVSGAQKGIYIKNGKKFIVK